MKEKRASNSPNYGILPITTLLAVLLTVSTPIFGQSSETKPETPAPAAEGQSDAAESLQTRIERARALAAAHQLGTAARELESIRATTTDDAVRNVTSVMLMNIYLEEGNYTRAESLLDETFRSQAGRKDRSIRTYFALAGQAVNGARAHLARYRSFGINVSDSALPAVAVSDLDRLRSLLERMIVQAKMIAKDDSHAYDSLALLEDVIGVRLSLSRDSEERHKWGNEYALAREGLASSQKQIASLRGVTSLGRSTQSPNGVAVPSSPPVEVSAKESGSNKAVEQPQNSNESSASRSVESGDTITAGLLNAQATKRVVPSYPQLAKSAGVSGVVRVYIGVSETGKVTSVFKSEGPLLLKKAAEDAAWKWMFPPPLVEGQPGKLTGFIEFNFTPKPQ